MTTPIHLILFTILFLGRLVCLLFTFASIQYRTRSTSDLFISFSTLYWYIVDSCSTCFTLSQVLLTPKVLFQNGDSRLLPSFICSPEVRVDPDTMGLLDVPFRPPLVHLRVQVLQAQNLSSLHQQGLNPHPKTPPGSLTSTIIAKAKVDSSSARCGRAVPGDLGARTMHGVPRILGDLFPSFLLLLMIRPRISRMRFALCAIHFATAFSIAWSVTCLGFSTRYDFHDNHGLLSFSISPLRRCSFALLDAVRFGLIL